MSRITFPIVIILLFSALVGVVVLLPSSPESADTTATGLAAARAYFDAQESPLTNDNDPPPEEDAAFIYFKDHLRGGDVTAYIHPLHGTTFFFPQEFRTSVFLEGEGEIILAQHPEIPVGVQIFTHPYDDATLEENKVVAAITGAGAEVLEIAPLYLYDDIEGYRVVTKHPGLGEIYEAWFLRDEVAYQISVYAPTRRARYVLLGFPIVMEQFWLLRNYSSLHKHL